MKKQGIVEAISLDGHREHHAACTSLSHESFNWHEMASRQSCTGIGAA